MNIVIVLDCAHINGGQAKVALDSALGLKARGHQPVVFASAGPVLPALVEAGIEVVCLGQHELVNDPDKKAAAMRGLWNRAAEVALAELLARQPRGRTVIHVHGYAKALSPSIARAIARSRLPVIYTMHEYFLMCPNGGFYNYREHHHCTLKPLSLACWKTHCDSRSYGFKLWRGARGLITNHVAGMPKVFSNIAYFHGYQRAIIEPHLPKSTRLYEVANPIEAEDLGPKADPASGDFLFLGRLSTEKGCPLFAEAAARAGITPAFVGDGPAAAELKAKYPNARFYGWADAAGVRKALRAARCLVFPSLWHEGQPLTVLESLALGTPVIAGDGSAGRESVVDGVTGLWFRQADVADLAEKLRLMQDDARVTAMSNAAHRRYWDHPFSLDRHVNRIEEVYADILGRQGMAGAA
ncbi:MAG TPA: glycosyltransferase family 4 protein [Beijerinckiaceae bacterium]|nr:glycosyltransferase family 4 protein [Beijerinckiaceae bacterium]